MFLNQSINLEVTKCNCKRFLDEFFANGGQLVNAGYIRGLLNNVKTCVLNSVWRLVNSRSRKTGLLNSVLLCA